MPSLAVVRQLEAVSFRGWPAETVYYDGTWAMRMTPQHRSKRLNSVNPLDPGDIRDITARVQRVVERYRSIGRKPVFRLSPLAPLGLHDYLVAENWERQGETIVMTVPIDQTNPQQSEEIAPLEDVEKFAGVSLQLHGASADQVPGLVTILNRIQPVKGMFVLHNAGEAVASALCVKDGAMAGLFDICTSSSQRRQGFGQRVVGAALKWAALQGARTAWLQVEADNLVAVRLYQRFGFVEAYRYVYFIGNDHD